MERSCCSAKARRVAGSVLGGTWLVILLILATLGSCVPMRSDHVGGWVVEEVGEGAWGGHCGQLRDSFSRILGGWEFSKSHFCHKKVDRKTA